MAFPSNAGPFPLFVYVWQGFEDEQDFVRRAWNQALGGATHFFKFRHQIRFGMQAARGVYDQAIDVARVRSLERVVEHSRWVATGPIDGSARVFDAATGVELVRLDHEDQVTAVAFRSVHATRELSNSLLTSAKAIAAPVP